MFVRDGAAGSVSAGIPVPGRPIAVEVNFGSATPIVIYSHYPATGGRLNVAILATVGADARSRALPFIIAGDF